MKSIETVVFIVLLSFTLIAFHVHLISELKKLELIKKKQNLVLEAVQKLSRKMYSLVEKEEFFREMWSVLKGITNSDEFTYLRFDGVDTLIPEFVEGIYREQILKVRLKLGEGFSGKVALEKTPKLLNNANKSSMVKHVPGTPNDDSALLGVPVIFGTDLYGVILLTKLGGKSFNEEELQITEIFVNIASGLIAGTNLINTIQTGVFDMLNTLIKAVELKDTYTAGHSLRVAKIAELLATKMGLPKREITKCKIGGLLHDIGKIGIKEEILKNGDPLSVEGKNEIYRHPELGYKLIKKLRILEGVADTILYHHEWYNGQGYPYGLKDGQIPISSRVVIVADAIDAMTSGRPHSVRKSLDEAFDELLKFKGIQFDPKVVEIALNSKEEIQRILNEDIKETILEDEELFETL